MKENAKQNAKQTIQASQEDGLDEAALQVEKTDLPERELREAAVASLAAAFLFKAQSKRASLATRFLAKSPAAELNYTIL